MFLDFGVASTIGKLRFRCVLLHFQLIDVPDKIFSNFAKPGLLYNKFLSQFLNVILRS